MSLMRRVLWALPILWVWKTATQMGVIYALHHGSLWPFWSGVYMHTFKGILLGSFFLPIKLGWIVLLYIGLTLVQPSFSGEIEMFWLAGVIFPFALLTGLAIIELYQRYGRLALVIRNDKVWQAIRAGFAWPGRTAVISLVYLLWYMIALVVFALGLVANATLYVGVEFLIISLMVQQGILLGRSAVSVGWIGSEVTLFERIGAKR